jgi:hypothetical protein
MYVKVATQDPFWSVTVHVEQTDGVASGERRLIRVSVPARLGNFLFCSAKTFLHNSQLLF